MGLLLVDVFAKMMFGILASHLAEVSIAVCFGLPVGVLADFLLAELELSHGVAGFQWPDEPQDGNENGNTDGNARQASQSEEY